MTETIQSLEGVQSPHQARAREIFERAGALLEGHFTYTSGRHGRHYVEKFRVLENPAATADLCSMMVERFRDSGVSLVVGPTTGGVILSFEVARQLGCHGIFAEKDADGRRVLRRGFTIEPGQRVLVVDDIVTTGGSVEDTVRCVRDAGGEVVGVALMCDRTGGAVDFGKPTFACLSLALESWAVEDCPLCAAGIPAGEKRGSGV
ncbi:MAG: orotate phosphoribosyltransferase [Candidatus Dormibacteria bacterium]